MDYNCTVLTEMSFHQTETCSTSINVYTVQTGSHSQPKQMESVYAQKCTICTQRCTKIYISSTILKRIRERTQIRRKNTQTFNGCYSDIRQNDLSFNQNKTSFATKLY